MDWYWKADLESASWDGCDLRFRAVTEAGTNVYVIRSHHLKGAEQRTGAEALALNLPALRTTLAKLSKGALSGQILTLG